MKGGCGESERRARERTVRGIGSRARARLYIYCYGRLLFVRNGRCGIAEAVSHMNKEELAAYATDNKAPASVVRVINENELDGPTLSV